MPVVRTPLISLASLLLIAPATARPTTRPDAEPPPAAVTAADAPPAPVAAGGNVRGGGGIGFSGPRRAEQLLAIRHLLGADDDDAGWKTLSPMVAKVLLAKQNTSSGAGMNWTVSNDAGPVFLPSSAKPDTGPGRAMQDVRAAVADPQASNEQLARTIAAARDARQRARAEYEAAQTDLIAALTARQQAILLTIGLLD